MVNAARHDIVLLQSRETTSRLEQEYSDLRQMKSWQSVSVYGVLMDIMMCSGAIRGASGIGKSETALV